MANEVQPVVSGADYRRSIDGRVTVSSDSLNLNGIDIAWHTQSELATESHRPPTDDHQFVLYCSAEERGEYRYNDGDWRRYVKRRNDWFIAPAYENRIHWRWERTETPGMVCRIHIAPDMLDRAASSLFNMNAGATTLSHRMNINDAMLTHLAFELKRELVRFERNGRSDRYCRSLIDTFLFRLAGTYCELSADAPNRTTILSRHRKERIQTYIENRLGETVSLDEMADAVCMSKYHFCRVFRSSFGVSPLAYVRRQRLDRAERLLRETDLPIAHIANALGFSTDASFARAFKLFSGLAPRNYRKTKSRPRNCTHRG